MAARRETLPPLDDPFPGAEHRRCRHAEGEPVPRAAIFLEFRRSCDSGAIGIQIRMPLRLYSKISLLKTTLMKRPSFVDRLSATFGIVCTLKC